MLRFFARVARTSARVFSTAAEGAVEATAAAGGEGEAVARVSTFTGTVNKVVILGRLGANPTRKVFENGGAITSFSVATDDAYLHQGEVKKRVDWHRVTVHDEKYGEALANILGKGARVYVEGQVRYRKIRTQDGQEKMITEINVNRKRGGTVIALDRVASAEEVAAPAAEEVTEAQ